MDMMKKDQKFCIQTLNIHFLTYFKALLLKTMLEWWLKKNKLKNYQKIFFLPSTTDCKEKINKFFDNINLHPIDCPYDDVNYSTKHHSFLPHHLDSRNTSEREAARKIVRNFLKTCSWNVKFKSNTKYQFINGKKWG